MLWQKIPIVKMKITSPALLLFFIYCFATACSQNIDKPGLHGGDLSVIVFEKELLATTDAQLIDVRTPEEFNEGHLKNALNINIDDNAFDKRIVTLDKSKTVFVYCLSGGRSRRAGDYLLEQGFNKVFNLQGGIMKWKKAGKEIVGINGEKNKTALSTAQFKQMVTTDKIVVADFYASWCQPCKVVGPMLEEVADEMKNEIDLIKINVDDNEALANEMMVDGIPTVLIFKSGTETWRHSGTLNKEEVIKEIEKAKQ